MKSAARGLEADAHDRALFFAYAALLALLAPIVVFAHRGVGPLALVLALLAGTRAGPWRVGVPKFILKPDARDLLVAAVLAFIAFQIYLFASGFWSPTPGAWKIAFNFGFSALAGGVLVYEARRRPPPERRRLARFFAATTLCALALLLFEAASGGAMRAAVPPDDPSMDRVKDMTALGRGLTAILPALAATAAILWRAAPGARMAALLAAMIAAAFSAALLLPIAANAVAILAALVAAAVGYAAPALSLRLVAALVVALTALSPFVFAVLPVDAIGAQLADASGGGVPLSWAQRLLIWREAGEAALACLPAGCGADYARALSQELAFAPAPGLGVAVPALPIHPHNVFLQVWLETGVPGAALFAAASALGLLALARTPSLPRPIAAAATAMLALALVSGMLEASLWQVWRIGAFALGAFGLALSYAFNEKR